MGFKFNHVHFKTPDPEQTAKWYVETLGATIVSENQSSGGMVSFRLDLHGIPINVTGYIAGQELDQHFGLEHVALDTDDFDSFLQRLKDQGTLILEERSRPDGGRIVFFEGPQGVRLEALEATF